MTFILGFDTETSLGYLRTICASDGSFLSFAQGKYDVAAMQSVIEWLYEKGSRADYNVFYNINFDFSIVMKPFIVENEEALHNLRLEQIRIAHEKALTGEEISEKEEDMLLKFKIGKFTVKLISHKAFSIKHKRKTVYFFDAANFYMTSDDTHMSLDYAGEKFLKRPKDEWGKENRERMGNDPAFFDENIEKIIQYCISDGQLTADLFALTIQSYTDIGVNFPAKPFSKASIFKQYLKDHNIMDASQEHYTAICSLPSFRIIRDSYRGAVNQILAVGKFTDITDADINSAYPKAMLDLVSIENTQVIFYNDTRFDSCDYKFYEIETTATDLLGVKVYNSWIYPVSKTPVKYCITEYDKRILDEYGRSYKILDAVGLHVPEKIHPFEFINRFFEIKKEVKRKYGDNSVNYSNIKILINAGYGVLAEHKIAETQFTNYVYASYITAQTRYTIRHAQLEIQNHNRQVISISTDGITYTGSPIHDNSEELGKLSVKQVKTYINFGSGVYIKDKNIKKRGFYDLPLDKLNLPTMSYTVHIKPRPLTLIAAIIQKKAKDIGTFRGEEKEFNPYSMLLKSSNSQELASWMLSDFFERSLVLTPYRYELLPKQGKL